MHFQTLIKGAALRAPPQQDTDQANRGSQSKENGQANRGSQSKENGQANRDDQAKRGDHTKERSVRQ